ncbi:hypothetical protein ACYOEI_21485 [Singulisphaera rosea]
MMSHSIPTEVRQSGPSRVGRVSRWLLGTLLAATIWWLVASVAGEETASVVVHVQDANVEVRIDDQFVFVEERIYAPLPFELRAGTHELSMRRGERILYQETFTIQGGEERVLMVWDRSKEPTSNDDRWTIDPRWRPSDSAFHPMARHLAYRRRSA